MEIYTIGFAKKNLREFINRLKSVGVQRVVDVRLNNTSQLAGYAKKDDLEFVLELLHIQYEHVPDLAPTEELMKAFKNKNISWNQYAEIYSRLLAETNPINLINSKENEIICLLCSEDLATHCHRRLLGEFLVKHIPGSTLQHL